MTSRVKAGLPSLRSREAYGAVLGALHAGKDRFSFRLIEFSVQSNHLHLIAEAPDAQALSRGMQGLLVRIAKALNKAWGRKGSVFADRYHEDVLRSPSEVRNALVYTLMNGRKHGVHFVETDPCSSGAWFEGWWEGGVEECGLDVDPKRSRDRAEGQAPVVNASGWLLRIGWMRLGRIGLEERPVWRRRGKARGGKRSGSP